MLRMMLGWRRLFTEWQVGDGREEALAAHVVRHARQGDLDDVIRVIDDFCYHRSHMMNVMARVMPSDAHLYSIKFNAANAAIARRIWDHAGVGDRVTVVVGTLGDGGSTLRRLRVEHGFPTTGSTSCSSITTTPPTCPTCGAC
jgi:catechol O-methyltransferase